MAKVRQCDDCGDIYQPHEGKFYPYTPPEHNDTVLQITPTRIQIHKGEDRTDIVEWPIDLCRKCLESLSVHIFVDRQETDA